MIQLSCNAYRLDGLKVKVKGVQINCPVPDYIWFSQDLSSDSTGGDTSGVNGWSVGFMKCLAVQFTDEPKADRADTA